MITWIMLNLWLEQTKGCKDERDYILLKTELGLSKTHPPYPWIFQFVNGNGQDKNHYVKEIKMEPKRLIHVPLRDF